MNSEKLKIGEELRPCRECKKLFKAKKKDQRKKYCEICGDMKRRKRLYMRKRREELKKKEND